MRGSVREQNRVWALIGKDDPEVGTFRGEDADGPFLLVQMHDHLYEHEGSIVS